VAVFSTSPAVSGRQQFSRGRRSGFKSGSYGNFDLAGLWDLALFGQPPPKVVRVIKDPPSDLVERRPAASCPPRSQGAGLLPQAARGFIVINEADFIVANETDFGAVHRTLTKNL
jgi:hypothetical protein